MRTVLTDARRGHAALFWFAVAMAVLAVLLVPPLLLLDQRTLLGAPLWAKPLKFALSFALYAGTLAWLLSRLRPGAFRGTGWVLVAASVLEMVAIVGQAARGVRSHFNDDTAADGLLYQLMGVAAAILWLATAAVAVRFLRERGAEPAIGTAVRLGLLIALAGMGVGIIMAVSDGHSIGVPDGGPGLPLVNWSTTGGDLRVGHFMGLHALQVLPLLAAALTAVRGIDDAARRSLVRVAGAGYAGLVAVLTWQALRAQPLLAPDALTLGVLGGLAVVVAFTGVAHLSKGRSGVRTDQLVGGP